MRPTPLWVSGLLWAFATGWTEACLYREYILQPRWKPLVVLALIVAPIFYTWFFFGGTND